MSEVSLEAKRLLDALAIEIEQEEAAYGAAVAEFITGYCRGRSDPSAWSEDLRLLARVSTGLFQRGYEARKAQELKTPGSALSSSLLDAARGFEMLADNSGMDATPEWVAECRKHAETLRSSVKALESFAEASGLPAAEVEN
jgi:hypothetical protein